MKYIQSGVLYLALSALIIYPGCQEECYTDDSRNERKAITLQSPAFPTGNISTSGFTCNIPENPAHIAYATPGPIESIVNCDMLRELNSAGGLAVTGSKWGFLLEVSGQCADQARYLEEFRFGESLGCESKIREMPVSAIEIGGDYVFEMCPDPHIPSNYGAAEYRFSLYVRSPTFENTDDCNCSNDIYGIFDDRYIVRAVSKILIEDLDLNYYFSDACIKAPLVFYEPIMYTTDCL
ncbi:hypothetical protein [Phaeodactylibacter luteus]|uniref:Uncharacterized protein n=1 Tax=Phaeodactylibacter luteus TaxID=1564516 RepID=A0A5C6S1P3_9BACT|nr:hypothetical protein [Phaeodactylibacter luteus]TXB67889.1 hypothetical protein FRY97_03320 [Phaeodactylibacter luteus]